MAADLEETAQEKKTEERCADHSSLPSAAAVVMVANVPREVVAGVHLAELPEWES